MTVDQRMKAIQTDSDIKIRALAPRLGVSEHALGSYLNGSRTVPYDVLIKFAQYFHVSADYLLGLTDEPLPPFSVSVSEQNLIERFRTLGKEQKELILQNIDLMTQQNRR